MADTIAAQSNFSNPTGGLIQSPEINAKGTPTQKSIKDVGMAKEVVLTVIQANRNRQIVNSRILAKYNAERPYDSKQLESEGLGWKQNFTTKPLPLMIEKVGPRFSESVNGLKYLTNSKLSDKWENGTEKTEKFREIITKVIRARKGWRTLVEDIAFDNALFGHTVVAWLDEYTWFPKHFKQEECFLPDGIKQTTTYAQVAVLKEVYLPHELYDCIKDKETAEAVGWNTKNTIEQINKASPAGLREQLSNGGTIETWYQNAQRELTVGSSYIAGSSVIPVYTLLVREVTGKVSHYRLAGPEMAEVFSKDDRFESMDSCLAFFAFQKGNSTMHGSKGIGRDIYELAGMIDRTRNEIVDRSILSGKTLIQGDVKQIHRFKMNVIGAMIIIPNNWNVLENKIDGDIEPFLKLDAYFQLLVDQLIGSTSPRTFGGERTTKAEVDLFAAREEEGKDVRISRFLEQFVEMVATMQTRICDPDSVEEDAKAAQEELKKYMSAEEIKELAEFPVAGTVKDLTPLERQMMVAIAQEKRGNPLYNQRALEVQDLTARVGADLVKKILLPDNDPTESAEQHRFQQIESALLALGQPVPVSPRDNHLMHLEVIVPTAEQMGAALMQGSTNTQAFEAVMAHINEHFTRAQQSGIPLDNPIMKEVAALVKKAGPALAQLKQLDEHAKQVAQASQIHDQESQQIIDQGAPGAPPPPA
jgi:hypothetical protein